MMNGLDMEGHSQAMNDDTVCLLLCCCYELGVGDAS